MFKKEFYVKAKGNVQKWLGDETSTLSSESGLLTVGGLLVAGGVMTLMFPKIKEGFSNVGDKFVSASGGSGMVADPLGTGQADWK